MNSHVICRSCRIHLLLLNRGPTTKQFARTISRDASSTASTAAQNWNELSSGIGDGASSNSHVHSTSVGRYSRRPIRQARDMLELLVADQPPPTNAPSHRVPRQQAPYPEAVTTLVDEMVHKVPGEKSDALLWAQLQDLATRVQNSSIKVLGYKRRRLAVQCSAFASRQTARWVASLTRDSHVEQASEPALIPSHMLAILRSATVDLDLLWPRTLWLMASGLLELSASQGPVSDEYIAELMKVWHLCLTTHAREPGAPEGWFFLPRRKESAMAPLDPEQALLMCVDRSTARHRSTEWSEYTGALLTTLDLLERHSPAFTEPHRYFMTFFRSVPDPGSTLNPPFCLRAKLETEQGSIRDRYMEVVQRFRHASVPDMQASARQIQASEKPSTSHMSTRMASNTDELDANPNHGVPSSARRSDKIEKSGLKNLARAVEQQSISLADSVLRQVFDAMQNRPGLDLGNKIFESLILTYFSLRNPQKALGVWKVFLQAGRQPTVHTYTALMHGSQKIHDLNGSETFWQRMRQSGIQPDAKAWGQRIWALLRGGRIQPGLDAMAEMSSEWLRAARHAYDQASASDRGDRTQRALPSISASKLIAAFPGDVNHVPRPNIVIVNSAVAALASKNNGRPHIGKVISWGRAFGIEPDQVIYNALLNLCLKNGETSEAIALLSRMQQKGLEADSTTWTVLLTNLVEDGSLDGMTATEQQGRVIEFMSAIEQTSPRGITEKGYAVVIDRLLKKYGNSGAAQAVLSRMLESGAQPTPHIYTILVTAFFDQKPSPNFAAIDALWSDIQAQNGGRGAKLDHIFLERMIEGYAANHHSVGLQPAFGFMNRVLDTGRKPSWVAMTAIIRALTERQDWNRLNQLVHDVAIWERRAGPTGVHVGENEYHRTDFWRAVLATEAMGNNIDSLPAVKV